MRRFYRPMMYTLFALGGATVELLVLRYVYIAGFKAGFNAGINFTLQALFGG